MSMRNVYRYLAVLSSVFAVLWVPAVAHAEEALQSEKSLITIIIESGWSEWIIVLLSVVALALVIQILVTIRREKLVPPDVLAEIETLIDEGSYEEALSICESEDCFFTRVFGAGLAKVEKGYGSVTDAIAIMGEEQSVLLTQQVGYLSLIASSATMLGLFGTVYGMIGAFNVIASKPGGATAKDLAVQISMALVTTFTGLVIAIPVTAVFVMVRNRVTRVLMEVNAIIGELLEKMKGQLSE
ncbi:MAG: MotA/TolQ/ExbB proton channel family protein [Candidatus Brocadiia bacterium]